MGDAQASRRPLRRSEPQPPPGSRWRLPRTASRLPGKSRSAQRSPRSSPWRTIREPKTEGSRRQVFLAPMAVKALQGHRLRQNAERLNAGPSWEENDLVFPTHVGRPLSSQNLTQRHFHPLLKRLSLPKIRFHDLRHTAATLLLAEGVHPKIVSEMLGHTEIGITLNLYSHVTTAMHESASGALGRLLDQPGHGRDQDRPGTDRSLP